MASRNRREPEIPALSGDTPLRDHSVSPANSEPVFSGPPWEAKEEESSAPLSLTEEINRARRLESERILTAKQFTGTHPTVGGGLPEENLQQETAQQPTQQGQQTPTPNETEAEEEEMIIAEDEEVRAMEMAARQNASRERSLKENTQRAESVAQNIQSLAKNGKATARIIGEGVQLAAAETIVPLLTLIGQLNLQLIYKYFFKGPGTKQMDALLEPTFPEEVATIGIDCGSIGCCACGCALPIALIIAIIFGFLNFVPGLTSLLDIIL